MKKFCVYKHTCPNGKVYIGMTQQNPLRRWRGGSGYRTNTHFYRAIQKYGWDNIVHEILFSELSEEEAKEEEVKLIALYKSTDVRFGYNRTEGGDFRLLPTPEQIEKMRAAITGKRRTEEQRQHYRDGAKKRPKRLYLSEKHKENISKSLIGNKRAVGNHAGGKAVVQFTLDGIFIARYISAAIAAKEIGCDNSGISRCCRENLSTNVSKTKYKGKYSGYRWYYINLTQKS